MKRSTVIYIIVFAFMLIGCGILVLASDHNGSGATATVYLDGEIVAVVDLNAVTETWTLAVGGNTVEFSPGHVRMLDACCPDGLCVRQGYASVGKPVICLPNRVMLVISGPADTGVDAVAG